MQPIRIANWEEDFEIAQSRRRSGRLSWVAIPTRHDSRGYRKLMRLDNSSDIFTAWIVMIQVSARSEVRGTLADGNGNPLTYDDLEAMTDVDKEIFEVAIPILREIGWIEHECSELARSGVPPCSEGDTTTVQNKNSTEQKQKQRQEQIPTAGELKNSHRSLQVKEAKRVFELVPEKHRTSHKRFVTAFIEEVIDYEVDSEVVIKGIRDYFKSPIGKSRYFRNVATLVEDRVWEESPNCWKRTDEAEESNFDGMFKEGDEAEQVS